MIAVRKNKKKEHEDFAVIIHHGGEDFFFTERAARELRDKLSSVLAELKKEAKE